MLKNKSEESWTLKAASCWHPAALWDTYCVNHSVWTEHVATTAFGDGCGVAAVLLLFVGAVENVSGNESRCLLASRTASTPNSIPLDLRQHPLSPLGPPLLLNVWWGSGRSDIEVSVSDSDLSQEHGEFGCRRWKKLSEDAQTLTHTLPFLVRFWMLGMNVLSDKGCNSARTHTVM